MKSPFISETVSRNKSCKSLNMYLCFPEIRILKKKIIQVSRYFVLIGYFNATCLKPCGKFERSFAKHETRFNGARTRVPEWYLSFPNENFKMQIPCRTTLFRDLTKNYSDQIAGKFFIFNACHPSNVENHLWKTV